MSDHEHQAQDDSRSEALTDLVRERPPDRMGTLSSRQSTPPVALVCASHTPLMMDERYASRQVCADVQASFDRMAEFVRGFAPDQIIQFSPDHFHGFHYDVMPSFCIGAAARSVGDWNTASGKLNVDEAFALDLLEAIRDGDIDIAVSFDMAVDHGFVQIWEAMFGTFEDLPIVPIFVNAIGYPLPRYRRARLLGEAVGRFAKASGRRVLFAASGGLSHDPIVPRIVGAAPELRDRLIGRAPPTVQQQQAREQKVREAAARAMNLEPPCKPLNPAWDREFLSRVGRSDWDFMDAYEPDEVERVAGAGANEILAWIAAAAALAASGPFEVVQEDYSAIPGWIASMAHFAARPKPSPT